MAIESVKVNINAEDNASQVFDRVSDNANSSFGKISGLAATAGKAIAGIGLAAGTAGSIVGGFAIKSGNELEKGLIKYETLLDSADAARERMDSLTEFTAKTPFQLDEVMKGDIMLQGFGIRTEEMLKNIGNAAAISGSSFNDLSMVMGQLSQTNDLENIKQLVERGVVSFDELKNAGIEFAENGSIKNSTEETFEAVTGIMNDKFSGGMEKLSNTVSGKWSTIKDEFTLALADLAENSGLMDFTKQILDFAIEKLPSALETAKSYINDFTSVINTFTEPLISFFNNNQESITSFFKTMKETGMVAFETIGNLFQDVFGGLSTFFKENKDFLINTFTSLGETVQSVFQIIQGAVGILKKAWDSDFAGITTRIKTTWATVKYFGTGLFEIFGGLVDTLGYLSSNWEYIWNKMQLTVKEFANSTVDNIETFVNAIVDGVNTVLPKWAELDSISLDKFKFDTTKEKAFVDALKPEESLGDIWSGRMGNISEAAETYINELKSIKEEREEKQEAAKDREERIIAQYKAKQNGENVQQNNYYNMEIQDDATADMVMRKAKDNERNQLASLGVNID